MSGIICYENVDICYNGSPVIKKVSFSAEKGEILGIAGESGSGKSTLIKAAIGLLGKNGSVTGGKIWYEEKKSSGFKMQKNYVKSAGAKLA